MSIANELKSRWKAEFSTYGVVAPLHKHLTQVLDSNERLAAKRAELNANRDLSDEGRAKAMKAAAAKEAVHVAKANRALRVAQGKVQQQRVALTPTVSNKTDVAAAFLRQEIRASLRGMERASLAAIANDPKTDTTTLEAMFEGPTFLTGIDAGTRDQLLKVVLERTAAPALAVLDNQAEALTVVGAAVQATSGTLRQAAAIGNAPDAFDKWLAQVAPPTAEEIAADKNVYRNDSAGIDALSLPFAQRSSLIDQLLAANTAEVKAA
jgi:hypothetical protein